MAGPRISSPVTSGRHKDIRSHVGAKVTEAEKKRIKNRQQAANRVSFLVLIIVLFFKFSHIVFTEYFFIIENSFGLSKAQSPKGCCQGRRSKKHDFR